MNVLNDLQPQGVMRWFEALCAIPHGSRDTKRVSDFCVAFAKERGLRCVQDAHNNVVIYAPASAGYETHPTVILQGHLDMVCEKEPDCDIDFAVDGLRLAHDDTYIYAEGTTLGGDDGIAVAYALAVLDDPTVRHPPLEVVFTVDEEIGMLGADAMDMSVLSGRVLLNCDSEDEGILTVSCAGGATSALTKPLRTEAATAQGWRVGVRGLTGGHSGVEINQGRANANKTLAAVLASLPVCLSAINGGSKDNAIPRASEALLTSDAPNFAARFASEAEKVRSALPSGETAAEFYCEPAAVGTVLTAEDSAALLALLNAVPNGVQAMSADIAGLVQTSLNLGILKTEAECAILTFSVRSSVNAEKTALIERLVETGRQYGASYSESGAYPAWEYRRQSPLRDVMVACYERLYGKKPVVEAIHAGLECGIFSDRLKGLDAVSFGPQMHDIHTTRERLDIASTRRTWDFLLAVLAAL